MFSTICKPWNVDGFVHNLHPTRPATTGKSTTFTMCCRPYSPRPAPVEQTDQQNKDIDHLVDVMQLWNQTSSVARTTGICLCATTLIPTNLSMNCKAMDHLGGDRHCCIWENRWRRCHCGHWSRANNEVLESRTRQTEAAMCVREHGCGLHVLHNGERVARFSTTAGEALSKICNCGISASICTVRIMATCRRTTGMSTNLSMNCGCGTCGICTDLCTVRPWAPVVAQQTGIANNLVQDLQLWNLREHLHSQDHGHLSSHNNNRQVNKFVQDLHLLDPHGLPHSLRAALSQLERC